MRSLCRTQDELATGQSEAVRRGADLAAAAVNALAARGGAR